MMNNLETTKMTTTKAPPMTETKMTARNVQVFYGEKQALKDVNINIRPRSVTAFIGPSGCGKSTFLRCINRMNDTIELPRRGQYPARRKTSTIPQRSIDVVQLRARSAWSSRSRTRSRSRSTRTSPTARASTASPATRPTSTRSSKLQPAEGRPVERGQGPPGFEPAPASPVASSSASASPAPSPSARSHPDG